MSEILLYHRTKTRQQNKYNWYAEKSLLLPSREYENRRKQNSSDKRNERHYERLLNE